MSKDKPRGDKGGPFEYDVGYGKPPASGQFEQGRSGNITGRPRRAAVVAKCKPLDPADLPTMRIMREQAYRMLPMVEGNASREITATEAYIRKMQSLGLKNGNRLALQWLIKHNINLETEAAVAARERYEGWSAYVGRETAELERRRKAGLPSHEPLPHPDDIHLSPPHEVTFYGPASLFELEVQRVKVRYRDACMLLVAYQHWRQVADERARQRELRKTLPRYARIPRRQHDEDRLDAATIWLLGAQAGLPERLRLSDAEQTALIWNARYVSHADLETRLLAAFEAAGSPLPTGLLAPITISKAGLLRHLATSAD